MSQPRRTRYNSAMAELVLLSLARAEIAKLHRTVLTGDRDAVAAIEAVWDDYRGRALACFLCDREVSEFPPFAVIFGDIADPAKAVAAPLCPDCRDMPQMLRWNRCIKMLKAMHKARTGRDLHYVLAPPGRSYGRRKR